MSLDFWLNLVLFQVFQLTTLAIRGPSGERFTRNLDWVAIREEVVRGVPLCVQDFVRDPVFTQRKFSSETGVTMLSEAATISDRITSSSASAPWSKMESESLGQIIADLMTSFESALDRRRVVKDMSKQWHALGAVRPSSGESSSQNGVRIPPVVEEGQVDCVPVVAPSRKVAGHSRHQSLPVKGKKKVFKSPVKMQRKFGFSGPSASSRKRGVVKNPTFASALASLLHCRPVEKLGEVGEVGKRYCFLWASITSALLVFCYYFSCSTKLFVFFIVFFVHIYCSQKLISPKKIGERKKEKVKIMHGMTPACVEKI